VFAKDGVEDGRLNFLIVVNRDVAETDHVFHGGGAGLADDGVLSEQLEGVAAGLGDSKASLSHAMHGEINRRLAGAEDVQNDGILDGEIIEPARIIPVFLRDALQAAADDRRKRIFFR
jgi:hypothetical protein